MDPRSGGTAASFWGDVDDGEALRRYRALADAVDGCIYHLDAEGRFVAVDDATVELTGYDREDLLGSHASLVLADEEVERIERAIARRLSAVADHLAPVEVPVRMASGGTVYCELRVQLLLEDGEFQGTIGIARPAASGTAERELEKYETIVETVDDGIYVKDADGRFTMVNEAYAELTGYDREELLGSHASLVVDETAIEESRTVLGASDEADVDATVEAEIQRADGETVPAEGSFATIETGDGSVEEVGVVRDVSKQQEYRRKLEASNERLEQFAHAVSHDLREPLRMVTSYLQLLERRYGDELDDEAEEFIDFAVDGADRMRELIDGLLEYSRVDDRGEPLAPVDLEAVVADVREALQVRIRETDAEIAVDSLPTVRGDERQLRQVFQNLLRNAIEYSDDDPPRIEISAVAGPASEGSPDAGSSDGRGAVDGDEWVVSVRDEGIGMDPDATDRIFEVFQRLQGREDDGGTGIGLAICRRIVERHGGEIWVDTEPGEGTTFSFTLPAVDDSAE